MKILIFIEGNILDETLNPISKSIEKLNTWIEKGAEVEYLTGVYKFVELKKMTDKMEELGFSGKNIHARQPNEKYEEIVENEAKPRVLIENKDNSGETKTVGEKMNEEIKCTKIVLEVKQGLDNLPEDLEDLKHFGEKEETLE